eukprot:TRINITY_DN48816_c0_g1_i1.p1 TRINITY_DN48816_c0_g1~~TRINITY_DN48816_c0_g1_i1.p1  ORF type:complete len:1476 (+),score=285.78 TRINITY_DN48816_c0_g1_i1:305-4732(+)
MIQHVGGCHGGASGVNGKAFRAIVHLDLDCFYAQVEHRRLGIGSPPWTTRESPPLAVQQWDSLIAVNYAARACGVKRGMRAGEAAQACQGIQLVHVETIGDGTGGSESNPDRRQQKACLRRYRQASEEVFTIFMRHATRVEVASIDEAYIDITAEASRWLASSAESQQIGCMEELAVEACSVVGCPPDPREDELLLAAGYLVERLRGEVQAETGFTVSAGIAENKLCAKLGSACHKPNRQTLVPRRSVQTFMQTVPLKELRGLGGKLGDRLRSATGFEPDTACRELMQIPLATLQKHLGEQEGAIVWHLAQGHDGEEVKPNTKRKQYMSFKSFQPLIPNLEALEPWLANLAGELVERLQDDPTRVPRSLVLQHRGVLDDGHSRRWVAGKTSELTKAVSRSCPFPAGNLSAVAIITAAKRLLRDRIEAPFPCSRLALGVTDFTDVPQGPQITSFFQQRKASALEAEGTVVQKCLRTCAREERLDRGGGLPVRSAEAHDSVDESLLLIGGTPAPQLSGRPLAFAEAISLTDAEVTPTNGNERSLEAAPAVWAPEVVPLVQATEHDDAASLAPTQKLPPISAALPVQEIVNIEPTLPTQRLIGDQRNIIADGSWTRGSNAHTSSREETQEAFALGGVVNAGYDGNRYCGDDEGLFVGEESHEASGRNGGVNVCGGVGSVNSEAQMDDNGEQVARHDSKGQAQVASFHRASRLHFLGTWRERFERWQRDECSSKDLIDPTVMAALTKDVQAAWDFGGSQPRWAHLDMDCFFVAVATRDLPNGAATPAAVTSGTSASSEICSANYAARRLGVTTALWSVGNARKVLPTLKLLPVTEQLLRDVEDTWRQVYQLLVAACSGRDEDVILRSCDEAAIKIVDVRAVAWSEAIRRAVCAQTRCTCSVGVGPSQVVAKLAVKSCKPDGVRHIEAGDVPAFLAEVPTSSLPQVGRSLAAKLEERGLRLCQDVQAFDRAQLRSWFGSRGEMVWANARGEDFGTSLQPVTRKTISAEINWGVRLSDRVAASRMLDEVSRQLSDRLLAASATASHLTLKLKIAVPGWVEPPKVGGHGMCDDVSRSATLSRPAKDAPTLFQTAMRLLDALAPEPKTIRGVGLACRLAEAASTDERAGLGKWFRTSSSSSGGGAFPNASPIGGGASASSTPMLRGGDDRVDGLVNDACAASPERLAVGFALKDSTTKTTDRGRTTLQTENVDEAESDSDLQDGRQMDSQSPKPQQRPKNKHPPKRTSVVSFLGMACNGNDGSCDGGVGGEKRGGGGEVFSDLNCGDNATTKAAVSNSGGLDVVARVELLDIPSEVIIDLDSLGVEEVASVPPSSSEHVVGAPVAAATDEAATMQVAHLPSLNHVICPVCGSRQPQEQADAHVNGHFDSPPLSTPRPSLALQPSKLATKAVPSPKEVKGAAHSARGTKRSLSVRDLLSSAATTYSVAVGANQETVGSPKRARPRPRESPFTPQDSDDDCKVVE